MERKKVSLSLKTGTSRNRSKVMFEAVRGASFQDDMAPDDITFINGPWMEEVGCFQDNEDHRAFPTMLKNLRSAIDWHHLEKIVQKCAMLTKENNYTFYGGCWSGESSKVQYDRWGAVDRSQCPFGDGAANINAVYRLLS